MFQVIDSNVINRNMFLWLSMNFSIFFYKRKPQNKKFDASTDNGFVIGGKNF